MLVIHGAWVNGLLGVWAEDTARGAVRASRGTLPSHPFAASPAALARALGVPATGPRTPAEAREGELTVLLPGSSAGPLPSPESGPVRRVRRPKISAWRVPALLLRPPRALSLLGSLTDPDVGSGLPGMTTADPEDPAETGEPAWRPGLSLRYLAVLAEHAWSLVRRGRVLPGLVTEEGTPAARWRPVIAGADRTAFHDLATAMPPVCRATPEERPAAEVLAETLSGLVDGAARLSLPDRLLLGHRPGLRAPLPDRWLYALTGEDATLPAARPAEAKALGEALDGWFAAAHELDGPVRACFRLIEPSREGGPWKMEFGLVSTPVFRPAARKADAAADGEPSGYLSAEHIRAGRTADWLPDRPMEVLRAELARAARLHPDLHGGLRDPEPTGLTVETAWAFSFLRHGAPALRAAGYGVLLPAWAGRQGLGLKLTARAITGQAGLNLDDRVGFSLEAAVGDHTITAAELARLAGLRVPLAQVGGRWVELDERQLKAALAVVERHGESDGSVGEVIREVARGGREELPLVAVEADGLLGDLLSGEAEHRLTPVRVPRDLRGTLRPYQRRGLAWLSFLSRLGVGGVLADDMGLGKTVSTLSLLLSERESGTPGPTLLICPMSLLGNWQKEAARFAPSLRVHIHHGGARKRGDELASAVREADLIVTTYGTVLRDAAELTALEWERVVCDEAQAIKNSAARQSVAVRSLGARTRLALTGTPVENRLSELWSIMEFCNPGLLGPAKGFQRRYQEPIETRNDGEAIRALRRATGPFVLRRLKTDRSIISDLPEKLEMKVWCTLTPEQAELYEAVANDMLSRIDGSSGIERRGNVMATMTRLKQICNHPAHLLKDGSRLAGRSGKLSRLEELAAEIVEEGDKALVFTQYTEFGSLLQPYLAALLDRPVLWLHGGLPKSRRERLVERFQHDDEPMLFLLSLKAAGTGLNLTAASHVIHVDRWWNPAVEDQATDRAFRIGQTKNVQVRKFICLDTLEERIDEMIERKKALAESVVGTGEDWIADLSTERLRELFTLGPRAVS